MKINTTLEAFRFSVFCSEKGINETHPTKTLSLKELQAFITHDDCAKYTIPVYSCNNDVETYKQLKSSLPSFTPHGVFTKRGKDFITEYNGTILPIDIDDVGRDRAGGIARYLFSNNPSCFFSAVSPSGKGVKAMFLLKDPLPWDSQYQLLKFNLKLIEHELGIDCFDAQIDPCQWSRGQTMFLMFPGMNDLSHKEVMFNHNATPLQLSLSIPTFKTMQNGTITFDSSKVSNHLNSRIYKYLDKAITNVQNDILSAKEGNRHHAIGKVCKIASIIHYCSAIREHAYKVLHDACIQLYSDNPTEGNRCFQSAWYDTLPCRHETIEKILADEK